MNEPVQMTLELTYGYYRTVRGHTRVRIDITPLSIASQITYDFKSTGLTENYPEQKWAAAFIDLLLAMKKVKDKAVEAGKEFPEPEIFI